jgi:D-alanine-D-alanine ligase
VGKVGLSVRILVLFDLARPAPQEESYSPRSLLQQDRRIEAEVLTCLRRSGHEVDLLAVFDNVKDIVDRIYGFAPDVVFNLCESFRCERVHEPNIPALLDLLKVPYTGAGPDGIMLCQDKALAKKLLSFHGVRVANFVVSHRDRPLRSLKNFSYPAFVKPIAEESSDGISKASFAKGEEETLDRARFIHESMNTDALIEEYIDGRELTVGVLGNNRLTVLPPQEIFFGNGNGNGNGNGHANGAPRFATSKAKWDEAYREKWGIHSGPAAALPPGMEAKLDRLARRVYRILHIRGLGRIDLRLTAAGETIVMEANPNPSLARVDDVVVAAGRIGIDYDALINKMLENAMQSGGDAPLSGRRRAILDAGAATNGDASAPGLGRRAARASRRSSASRG